MEDSMEVDDILGYLVFFRDQTKPLHCVSQYDYPAGGMLVRDRTGTVFVSEKEAQYAVMRTLLYAYEKRLNFGSSDDYRIVPVAKTEFRAEQKLERNRA